jgi:hypothetical protein
MMQRLFGQSDAPAERRPVAIDRYSDGDSSDSSGSYDTDVSRGSRASRRSARRDGTQDERPRSTTRRETPAQVAPVDHSPWKKRSSEKRSRRQDDVPQKRQERGARQDDVPQKRDARAAQCGDLVKLVSQSRSDEKWDVDHLSTLRRKDDCARYWTRVFLKSAAGSGGQAGGGHAQPAGIVPLCHAALAVTTLAFCALAG